MWKDINYDCGGFSRKLQSELVAQKGAWMEMRWPRPIWCFLGTLNWSQFPSLLRQPLTGSVSISFVLLVRFDEQSWWDNAPAKYNQLKWWNAQQMWIKRKRCKFLEDQIDSLMWNLIYYWLDCLVWAQVQSEVPIRNPDACRAWQQFRWICR